MRLQSRLLDAGHVPRDYFASERAARDWMPGSAGDEVLRVLVIRQSRLDPLRFLGLPSFQGGAVSPAPDCRACAGDYLPISSPILTEDAGAQSGLNCTVFFGNSMTTVDPSRKRPISSPFLRTIC